MNINKEVRNLLSNKKYYLRYNRKKKNEVYHVTNGNSPATQQSRTKK